jgi:hypothetical protein
MIRSDGDRDKVPDLTRLKAPQLDEDKHHHGQRPAAAMLKPEHMNEPDPISNTQSQLSCLSEPCTHESETHELGNLPRTIQPSTIML